MGASNKGTELSRAERKSKKRQAEDAIPNLPSDSADIDDSLAVQPELSTKKRKRASTENNIAGLASPGRKAAKREKKRPKELDNEEPGKIATQPTNHEIDSTEFAEDAVALKKSKKERKAERRAKQATRESITKVEGGVLVVNDAISTEGINIASAVEENKPAKKNNRNRDKKRKAKAEASIQSKPARFIVFIGNLPYSATTESIAKHFASVKPIVRHRTDKNDPSKSKGFAFLEFDGYDHMKTCLKLFHHSSFDDGISAPRKLNVELTAGGGGNTKDRKAKIDGKNHKLNEQRVRRMQEEEKVKWSKTTAASANTGSIHPSRRGIVPS